MGKQMAVRMAGLGLAAVLGAVGLVAVAAPNAAATTANCEKSLGGGVFGNIKTNLSANKRCTPGGSIQEQVYLGDFVRVACYNTGPRETGWGGTNDDWDYLYDYDTESSGGYVADVWVDTGGDIETQVPHCSGS